MSKHAIVSGANAPSLVGAAVLLGGTALASRVLGLIRDRLLAGTFGASASLDAYYAAFRVPDLVYSFLVLGALSASFIPIFVKLLHEKKDDGAFDFANKILNAMGLLLIALSALGAVFAEPLVRMLAPGFADSTLALAVPLSRTLYLSTFFLGLSSVFGGILQGFKRFVLYAIAPLLYNIGIIAGVIVAERTALGIMAVAWGVVFGSALHLLIQMVGSWQTGWRYRLSLTWKDVNVRDTFRLMGPRVLGLAITQLNLIVMTAIASLLAVGSVTIFHFAHNIQYVPIGMIGISFAIAAFPGLSEGVAANNAAHVKTILSQTTRLILFFILPLSVVFLLLRAQIVRVVLGAGAFGWNETIVTADVLAFFTLSLFAQALIPLFVRVFFAYKNTLIPTLIALFSAAVNIAAALYFVPSMGVVGIAAGFSLASLLQCALLWIIARTYVKDMDDARLIRMMATSLGAAVVAGLMIQSLKELYGFIVPLSTFVSVLGQGLVAGGGGLVVYAIVCWACKSEEWTWLIQALRRRLFRKVTSGESGDEALDATV